MNKAFFVLLSLVIAGCVLSDNAFTDNLYSVADFDDDKVVEAFAGKFKNAVIDNNKQEVASMVRYPIEATIGDKVIVIKNRQEFIAIYDDIFDKKLYDIISAANTHNMFANYQGVMLSNGEVWFGGDAGDIKVIAIGPCRRYDPEGTK